MKAVIKATLIATLVGTGAWLFGVSHKLWPAHPMIATFILTIVIYFAAMRAWRARA